LLLYTAQETRPDLTTCFFVKVVEAAKAAVDERNTRLAIVTAHVIDLTTFS
jgi:hypothetical protein